MVNEQPLGESSVAPAAEATPGTAIIPGVGRITLEEAQEMLRGKTNELLSCPPDKTFFKLTIDVQRLRVACSLLREIETGVAEPNTYREMSLLNRLVSGATFESDDEKAEEDARIKVAEDVLTARGLTPDAAGRILKVLQSAAKGEKREPDDFGGEDEADNDPDGDEDE